ncbi:MAG: GNAT family N-acetyltransferase [Promethearchaeota archaeon]
MYEGTLTRLRRLEVKDVSAILPLWNNYELRQYLPTPLPNSHDELVKLIESMNDAFTTRKGFTFGIEAINTNSLIGIIDLVHISWISRSAEVGLFAIFNPEYWGKGYGSDAMIVLLDFAFSVLDLHNVYLSVVAFNERAINVYKKLGFKVQGKLRELAFRNGKRYDIAFMDILKPEFLEKYGILPKKGEI